MQRSPKRNPYSSSRSSYSSGPNGRKVQSGSRAPSGNGSVRPKAGSSSRGYDRGVYAQKAQSRYGAQRPNGNYRNTRNAKQAGGMNIEAVMAFLRKYRRLLLLAAALVLVVVLIIVIVSTAKPKDSKVSAPVSTPVPQVEQTVLPTATPAPTAAPTPTAVPTPKPTMVTDYEILYDKVNTDKALGIAECARVDDSYFNDTVFVGDSVSMKLALYVKSERKTNPTLLGNARFLTAQNFSARNALKEVTETSIHPTYQGQKMKLEDAIAAIGPKRVYIMLGMNDAGISGVDEAVMNMLRLLRAIKDKSPDVQIIVQSCTPRVAGSRPTTEQLFAYDVKLYEAILELADYDIWFTDVAYVMRDENGKLYENYCSDLDSMALHFTNEGCRAWIDYLYTHALV